MKICAVVVVDVLMYIQTVPTVVLDLLQSLIVRARVSVRSVDGASEEAPLPNSGYR